MCSLCTSLNRGFIRLQWLIHGMTKFEQGRGRLAPVPCR
ncbi:MAG: hypothetical protein JWL99_7216 [Streptomyces oryziradicis]|jgi:hypothetical protein|nr:hypothetical protein [Actinacidiphila oryziradicis]